MILTIETAQNGFILRDNDEEYRLPTVIAGDDPVDETFNLLIEVRERIGHIGSRHDERRVRVVIEPGDKYVTPEVWSATIAESERLTDDLEAVRSAILQPDPPISHGEKRDPDDYCPKCASDLRGDPIPEKDQDLFGATHFSRKIGLYDRYSDRTAEWLCPDCAHKWPR